MFQNLSTREKVLLIIVVLAAVIGSFYYFLLGPQMEAYTGLQEDLETKEIQLQKSEAVLKSYQAQMEKEEQAKKQMAEFEPLFETDFTQGLALVLVGTRAGELQVTINNLEPGGIINKGSYVGLPVKLKLSGDYNNVRQLLSSVENLPNPVQVTSLEIRREEIKDEAAEGQGENIKDAGVSAVGELVIYSDLTPEGRLHLEQEKAAAWLIGRDKTFAPPASLPPYPGIPMPPAQPEVPSEQKPENVEDEHAQ